MAIQEQDTEFHDDLEHDGDFSDEERVPETGSKKNTKESGKGTPSWRLIEDYKDRKRLEDELEDLDEFDLDSDDDI